MSDRRYNTGKRLARALVAVPTLALAIAIVVYLGALKNRVLQSLPSIVAAAAGSALGRQVRIGSVAETHSFDHVTFRQVAVSDGPTFASEHGRTALSAQQVDVLLSANALIRNPTDAASYITEVRLTRPYAYIVRLPGNKFNFSNLFVSKPNPKARPFAARVDVVDGSVVFRDRMAPQPLQPAINRIDGLSGYADFGVPQSIVFHATGDPGFGRADTVDVTGSVLRSPTKTPGVLRLAGYQIRVAATNAQGPYWVRYFLPSLAAKVVDVDAGRANVALTIGQTDPVAGSPLDFSGAADIRGGAIRIADTALVAAPVRAIAGRISFTDQSLVINASGSVAGSPVQLSGRIVDFRKPSLAMRLVSARADIADLHGVLPFVPAEPAYLHVGPSAAIQATAIGPIASARYDVAFACPSATVYGNTLSAIHGEIDYSGHTLAVRYLVANAAGGAGNLSASGSATIGAHPNLQILAHLTGANMARVSLPRSVAKTVGGVTGTLDGDLAIRGSTATATVRLTGGSVHGIRIQQAIVRGSSAAGGAARIDRLAVIQPDGGTLVASGTAPLTPNARAPFAIRLAAAGVSAAAVAAAFGHGGFTGLTYFRGSIAGSYADPEVSGAASIFGAGFGRYRVDHVRADVSLTRTRLQVRSGIARRLGLSVAFSGAIAGLGTRRPTIAASASAQRAEIAGIDELLDETAPSSSLSPALERIADAASGTVDADAHVAGALDSPLTSFAVRISSAAIGAVDIPRLSIAGSYAAPVLAISQMAGTVAGAQIDGSASIDIRSRAVTGKLRVGQADLATIAQALGLADPLSGTAAATVTADGTLSRPALALSASVANGMYMSVPFDIPKLDLVYQDGAVSTAGIPVVIDSGPAVYTVSSAAYDFGSRRIVLRASIAGEHVARLIGIARDLGSPSVAAAAARIPSGTDGDLSAPLVALSGSVGAPDAEVSLAVSELQFGQPHPDLLSVAADVSYSGSTLSVKSLEARGPSEYLSASASIVRNGPIAMHLDASDIPLAMVAPFLPSAPAIGGTISDLTVDAGGTAGSPEISASVSLTDVAVGKFALDRIDSGLITIGNGRIDLAGITFVKTERNPGAPVVQHIATVRGSIPFDLSLIGGLKAFVPRDAPIALTAALPSQSVSLFTTFVPELAAYKLAGTVSAGFGISGTLDKKEVVGSLQIVGGSAQPIGLKTAFKNINVAASFNGTRGTISSTQIASSAGGSLSISGAIDLASGQAVSGATGGAVSSLLSGVTVDATVAATHFTIDEPKIAAFYGAGFRGVLEGQATVVGPLLRPTVGGDIQVAGAIGVLPTVAQTPQPAAPPPLFNPRFDLTVDVLSGGQIRSPQLTAVTDGKFAVAGDLYRPDVTGNLFVRSGRFSFPTAIFRIVPTGTVHFVYNPPNDTVEQVHIVATTVLSISPALLAANPVGPNQTEPYSYQPPPAMTATSGPQRYTVTVTISGDLGAPKGLNLAFVSDPPGLTTADILAALGGQQALNTLLAGGNVQLALQSEAQQIFTAYALPTLLAPVESSIATAFGLSEFNIDYEPQSPLMIMVTKQVTPRLSVSYERFVNSRTGGAVSSTVTPLQYRFSVHYSITNQISIGLSTDDQQNNEVEIGGAVGF